jgi:hypothetical protein
MENDHMLADLRGLKSQYCLERAERLEQHGLVTYDDLFRVLHDESAELVLRREACSSIFILHEQVDGRKAVPILLKLLNEEDLELRRTAILALGEWKTKRVANVLIELVTNRTARTTGRNEAIYILGQFKHVRIEAIFEQIMFDESEDFRLRSLAIEAFPRYENMIDTWVKLLADSEPDVRFWAAFRLAQPRDGSQRALPILDKVAAFDHILAKAYGWHVDREALRGLESIYSIPYRAKEYPNYSVEDLPDYGTWLVSPAAEYFTLMHEYRRWHEDWIYDNLPLPAFTLRVDANWLREEIEKAWSGVSFDARQPKPQTYVLDWHLQIDGENLLGGLHRDQYGLVLSGNEAAVYAFAAWYRSIIAAEHALYLYEWADEAIELTPGITPGEIKQVIEARDAARRMPAL